MKLIALPLDRWLEANTNLLVLSLNKKTRKYKQYFLSIDEDIAVPINSGQDLIFNTRLLLSENEYDLLQTLNRYMPGDENYIFTLKVFERTDGNPTLPLRALLAQSIVEHFKKLNKYNMQLEHGFILTQCVSNIDQPSLPKNILEEPNINRDVIAHQRCVHATLNRYCNLNDAILTAPH